jgi:hypothetical protein
MLDQISDVDIVFIEPSFRASQSLVTDLDAYLWWHKWTPLRAATWLGVRLCSLADVRRAKAATSSGYLAVLQKRRTADQVSNEGGTTVTESSVH